MEKRQEYYLVDYYAKDWMICVKTGFSFLHEGYERRGDLFVRPVSGDFCIHGIAPALMVPDGARAYSEFVGDIEKDRGDWATSMTGVLYLSPDDEEYVQKNCFAYNLNLASIRYQDAEGW